MDVFLEGWDWEGLSGGAWEVGRQKKLIIILDDMIADDDTFLSHLVFMLIEKNGDRGNVGDGELYCYPKGLLCL